MLQHLIAQDERLRMVPAGRVQLTDAVATALAELRALPESADPAKARVLARWTGIGLMALGIHDDAIAFLRRALDLATATHNDRAVISTELNLGDAYRYAGDAQTAEVLYRRALGAARARHPDLLDYALQHFGKHLMEQGGGSLAQARTHLREALHMRRAKGDAGLIESTQAAVDRVELLISRACSDAAAPAEDRASARPT
ncbi:tetratricopeptide repeat protein [Streptomyces albidoflavus]